METNKKSYIIFEIFRKEHKSKKKYAHRSLPWNHRIIVYHITSRFAAKVLHLLRHCRYLLHSRQQLRWKLPPWYLHKCGVEQSIDETLRTLRATPTEKTKLKSLSCLEIFIDTLQRRSPKIKHHKKVSILVTRGALEFYSNL